MTLLLQVIGIRSKGKQFLARNGHRYGHRSQTDCRSKKSVIQVCNYLNVSEEKPLKEAECGFTSCDEDINLLGESRGEYLVG